MNDPSSIHRGPIAWMIRNRVTPNLIMLVFLFGGLLAMYSIKQEVFPEFQVDIVTVSVPYPGASPEEVEQGILLVIEEEVRGLDGIKEMTSRAMEGRGTVTIELEVGADRQKLYQDVQQAVGRITTFPLDAEEPTVSLASRRRDVLEVHLFGNVDPWTLQNVAERVRDQLLQEEGITQIELEGARNFEIHVLPSMEALRRYDLSFGELAQRIARSSIEIPGGSVRTQGGEILVRFNERRNWAAEFAEIPIIVTADGSTIRLGQLAEVREALEVSNRETRYNGMNDIALEVYRIGEETPIGVSNAVRHALDQISRTLPEGVHCTILNDSSETYRQRRDLLLKNAAFGLVLVLVVLGMFLEVRLAFWVTLAIPISFLGTFLLLPGLDISMNMMSMFAFIVALGIVVVSAIVVGENIYEHRQAGHPALESAIVGTREVAMPVVFSILTNVVAFVPLLYMPGTMGKMWAVLPLVVISTFGISLVESLYILPMQLSDLSREPRMWILRLIHRVQQAIGRLLNAAIHFIYGPLLHCGMRARYVVVAFSIGLLAVVLAYALSGHMGMTLMPKVESDQAVVTAVVPLGSPMQHAQMVRERLEAAAREVVEQNGGDRLAQGIFSTINENEIQTRIYLTDPNVRPLSTATVTDLWRERTGTIAGVERMRFEYDRGGPGGGASITVELTHSSVDVLERAGERLAAELEQFPFVSDIDDGYTPGKPQFDFELTEEGRSLGLTPQEVASQLRGAFYGAQAIRQQRGRNEIRVKVLLPENQRSSEYDIEQMMIQTPAGEFVPLRQIARVDRGRAYTTINRRNGSRTLSVTANVTPDEMTNQVLSALTNEVLPRLMSDYPGLNYSYQGRQSQMRESLGSLGVGFLLCCLRSMRCWRFPSTATCSR